MATLCSLPLKTPSALTPSHLSSQRPQSLPLPSSTHFPFRFPLSNARKHILRRSSALPQSSSGHVTFRNPKPKATAAQQQEEQNARPGDEEAAPELPCHVEGQLSPALHGGPTQDQAGGQPTELGGEVPCAGRRWKWVAITIAAAVALMLVRPVVALAEAATAAVTSAPHGFIGQAVAHGHSAATVAATGSQWHQIVGAAWTGLVAGCLHTLTGPDHLAALAPLTIGRTRMESVAIGALWGCGHDAGQILFGLLFILLKDKLHLDVLRVWGARVVGVTLLAIGALGIQEARAAEREESGEHSHSHHHHHHHHDEDDPGMALAAAAVGGGGGSTAVGTGSKTKRTFGIATFVTGIVHGLQPDALLVVLPALAMPSRAAGAAFLALFLIGTVVAMGSYTAFIGSCSDALREKVPGITRKLSWGAALLAIGLGVVIIAGEVLGFQLF